jgi:hypothetical protein
MRKSGITSLLIPIEGLTYTPFSRKSTTYKGVTLWGEPKLLTQRIPGRIPGTVYLIQAPFEFRGQFT